MVKKKLINKIFCTFFVYFFAFETNNYSAILSQDLGNSFIDQEEKTSLKRTDSEDSFLDSYILGPGDLLEMNLYELERYSGNLKILNDGKISVPFVGNIYVSGYSIEQAKEKIKNALEKELIRPELDLKVLKARPIQVSLIGEVQRPGLYTLSTSESSSVEETNSAIKISGLPTLVNALQKAGGITNKSDLTSVKLTRRIPGEGFQYKKTSINLIELIFYGKQINNPYLMDGDIIDVRVADEIDSTSMEILSGNLSPSIISVNVIGEVRSPGIIDIPRNSSLNSAIMMAGGPINIRSKKRAVELYRSNRNGTVSFTKYRLKLGIDTSQKKNPILKNGDTIFVRKNLFASSTDVLDSVTKPMQGLISGITLFKLLEE